MTSRWPTKLAEPTAEHEPKYEVYVAWTPAVDFHSALVLLGLITYSSVRRLINLPHGRSTNLQALPSSREQSSHHWPSSRVPEDENLAGTILLVRLHPE